MTSFKERLIAMLQSSQHVPLPPSSNRTAPLPPKAHPARISGTALVGGVHLSNGVVGTASSWRLVLTGLTFPLLMVLAAVPTFVVVYAAQQGSDHPLIAYWVLGFPAGSSIHEYVLWRVFLNAAYLLSFLLVLRLSPLAGYHAAEHKVVNAIEKFGYLTCDLVRRMPRAHARCGTNLLVPVLTLGIFWPLSQAGYGLAVLGAALIAFVLRVPLGALVQNWATTREPSEKQLLAGIEAGRKLLHLWRLNPSARVTFWQALWRRGFPQMVLGLALAGLMLNILQSNYYHWLDW